MATHPTTAQPQPFPRIITYHANEQPQQFSRAMTSSQISSEQPQSFPRATTGSHAVDIQSPDVEADSLRSRASSVVSTGTRFSISTLPVEEPSHVDGLLGRLNHASAFRPRSIMSTGSYDQPAPPYESRSAGELPGLSTAQHDTAPLRQSSIVADEPDQSPTTSPENSLSMHYSRVVRTIDQNHSNQMRRLKEAHQEELGATRNAIDQTYRRELKAKAREVEKIREEMASLTATHEADVARLQREAIEQATDQAESHRIQMEKACNAIEDLWEARWKDRMRLAAEEANSNSKSRCDRISADKDPALEQNTEAIRKRDEAWITELVKRHPELKEEIHVILEGLAQSQGASHDEAPAAPASKTLKTSSTSLAASM